MGLILAGKIAPLERSKEDSTFKGCVLIDDIGGTIHSVLKGAVPTKAHRPPEFADATVIDLGEAIVLPGLIDLHNHIGYNTLPLWTEETQKPRGPFLHHDSWTRAPSYQKSVSWPAKALAAAAPEALLGYVQLRALVGGTTSIQGWPTSNRPAIQALRNIDDGPVGTTNRGLIKTSALTLPPGELAEAARNQRRGVGFIYHCAEGQVGSVVKQEFADAANAGCLDGPFIGIHCNAITKADWVRWSKPSACAVAWSPFSNLWLYGSTTDIASARRRKLSVCLGSDWGPSGTKNIQGELKVAALVARREIPGITDLELVMMCTANPGDALMKCWKKPVGRIEPGALADITVFRPNKDKNVWTHVVDSTEDDVMLVVYDGQLRYGDAALMKKTKRPTAPVTIANRKRRYFIPHPDDGSRAFTWAEIQKRIDEVRKDPKGKIDQADRGRRAYAGPLDSDAAPLELVLDMPDGASPLAGESFREHAAEIRIPPLPSLVHDDPFFKQVEEHAFHGRVLDGLAEFYR